MFPTEEEDAWRLLLKAALFNAQVAIYLLNDEKEETSCTTTLLSKAWVYSECSQLQGKAKRYVSSTAMQKTFLFSRTQQLPKTPSGETCLVAAVYNHFLHLLTPSPARQRKPPEWPKGTLIGIQQRSSFAKLNPSERKKKVCACALFWFRRHHQEHDLSCCGLEQEWIQCQKLYLLWKEAATTESHLMGIFDHGKVSKNKPAGAANDYESYKTCRDFVLITIGELRIKK